MSNSISSSNNNSNISAPTIFDAVKRNDFSWVEEYFSSSSSSSYQIDINDVNDVNDWGQTCLHICARYGYVDIAQLLINNGAQVNVKDLESGWTPLHFSFYYSHFRLSLLLIKYGAITDDIHAKGSSVMMKYESSSSSSSSISSTTSYVRDHDNLYPLDLLSDILSKNLKACRRDPMNSSIICFGKSDFPLGIPLSKSSVEVRPRCIESLSAECIVQVSANKYHSVAITSEGHLYSWGHGRGGRLGHGNEVTQPEPLMLRSLLKHRMKQIATGENHTIVVTYDGVVFIWGSDRYGQLGIGGKSNKSSKCTYDNSSLVSCGMEIEKNAKDAFSGFVADPRRIDALQKLFIVEVAAGDAHSLCRSKTGELYAWGSNKYGQLGLKASELGHSNGGGAGISTPKRVNIDSFNYSNSSSSSSSSSSVYHNSKGVNSITSASAGALENNSRIVQISASHHNTLLICRGSSTSSSNSPCNDVYQWGHGIISPIKIMFSHRFRSKSRSNSATCNHHHHSVAAMKHHHDVEFVPSPVNIIKVCSGQHHYVALAQDCSVYTWGMGGEQLGHGGLNDSHLSQPQLVEALLSDNGGGRIVDITAAGNRSCAITDVGELFTWGATCRQGVLTPGPSNYQPVPKKVPGVKQAIGVSAGEDHTLVLTGTTLPKLPLHHLYACIITTRSLPLPPSVHTDDSMNSLSVNEMKNRRRIRRGVKKEEEMSSSSSSSSHHLKRSSSRSNSIFDDLIDVDHDDDGGDDDGGDDDEEGERGEGEEENCDDEGQRRACNHTTAVALPSTHLKGIGRSMIPCVTIPSLMSICEREVAKSITTRTVMPALMFSEQYSAHVLADYCSAFINM